MTSATQATLRLNNAYPMPTLGVGFWQIPAGRETVTSATAALRAGFRLFDVSESDRNEKGVGRALRNSGLRRSQVFIQTKLNAAVKTYEETLLHFETSLKRLGVDYVDSYLIHAPWPWMEVGANYDKQNRDVWRAMQDIFLSGRARSIGVSNFTDHDLVNLLDWDGLQIAPAINQIELFPGHLQPATVSICQEAGIALQAYSPLATGRILRVPVLRKIASTLTAAREEELLAANVSHDPTAASPSSDAPASTPAAGSSSAASPAAASTSSASSDAPASAAAPDSPSAPSQATSEALLTPPQPDTHLAGNSPLQPVSSNQAASAAQSLPSAQLLSRAQPLSLSRAQPLSSALCADPSTSGDFASQNSLDGVTCVSPNALLTVQASSLVISPAQVALRYLLNKGFIPIMSARPKEYLQYNADLDFDLTDEQMDAIDALAAVRSRI